MEEDDNGDDPTLAPALAPAHEPEADADTHSSPVRSRQSHHQYTSPGDAAPLPTPQKLVLLNRRIQRTFNEHPKAFQVLQGALRGTMRRLTPISAD
jgi:hypothetical protein